MHFLLIGASGRTGKLVSSTALASSHTITALVRTPSAIAPSSGLTIVQGTPLNEEDVVRAVKASASPIDAVIFTLASLRATDSPFSASTSSPTMLTDAMRATLAAMQCTSLKKIVVLSSVGTGDSWASVNLAMKLVFSHTPMKVSRKDHEEMFKLLKETAEEKGIQWTSVRPWMLTEENEKEVKVWGEDGKGAGWMPKISRESVAKFLVRCAEGEEFEGRAPVITN